MPVLSQMTHALKCFSFTNSGKRDPDNTGEIWMARASLGETHPE